MCKNTGFSLIELVIVVAINAILAAIAVPNFLEAQVRSKISRVKSDVRSAATALEAYSVDYNAYPGGWPGQGGATFIYQVFELTTPVAYLTSVALLDPFIPKDWMSLHGYTPDSQPDPCVSLPQLRLIPGNNDGCNPNNQPQSCAARAILASTGACQSGLFPASGA